MRHLAEVAGFSATAGRSYDWKEIEAAIGTRLPLDYKLMAESFPDGWFRMFARVWFPDGERRLLGDFAQQIMDIVRKLPEDEDSADLDFPFPAYPERGGLLLCGYLRVTGWMFWVTGAGDPDAWPLVLADEEFEHWERFDGSLCEFLTELALGRFDASRFRDDYGWQGQQWIDIPSRPVFRKIPSVPESGWLAATRRPASCPSVMRFHLSWPAITVVVICGPFQRVVA